MIMKLKVIIKEFLKKYWKFILAFTGLNFFLFYNTFLKEHVYHQKFLWPTILLQLFSEVAIISLYAVLKNKKWKIGKIFIPIFILLGLSHLVITPFYQTYDENAHIARVYSITDGNFIAKADENGEYIREFPSSFMEVMTDAFQDQLYYRKVKKNLLMKDNNDKEGIAFSNTVSYNPIAYVPAIVGVSLGRTLNLPTVLTTYLGRFCTMIVFAVMCYFALKNMPKYKEFMLLIMLLPTTVQQGMAYSGDAMLFGAAFLLIAISLKYIYDKKVKISGSQISLMVILIFLIANCKSIVYLPIAFLLLLIPKERFKKPSIKLIIVGAMIVAAGVSLLWTLTQTPASSDVDVATEGGFGYILTHPFDYGSTLIGTLMNDFYGLIAQLFGQEISPYFIKHTPSIYTVIFIVLAFSLLYRNIERVMIKRAEKVLYALIPIMIVALVYTASFTQWGEVKIEDYTIWGIQGRYFTPLALLLPLCLQPKKYEKRNPISVDYVFMFGVFANSCILACKFLYNF